MTSTPASSERLLEQALEARKTSREVASREEIEAVLGRMASDASEVLAGENPVILAVMQGGVFTAVSPFRVSLRVRLCPCDALRKIS